MRLIWSFWLIAVPAVIGLVPPALESAASAQVFTDGKKKKPAAKPPSQPTRPPPTRRVPVKRTAPVVPVQEPEPISYDDPAPYCAAFTQVDYPGKEYRGPLAPHWVGNALQLASATSAAPAAERAIKWRCSQGRVVACATPADQDFCSEPSRETAPTEQLADYCRDKRRGAVPFEVTGPTVPVWICNRGKPAISGYRQTSSGDGFLADQWVDVTDLAPANMAGMVPKRYLASWKVPVQVGLLGSMKKSGVLIVDGRTDELVTTFGAMRIQGGNIGSSVGEVVYFGQNSLGQQAATGCVADLILQEASLTSLTVVEQYRSGKRGCRKPEQMVLQVREGQMLVNWMNPGKSKPKRSEWVQQFAK